jgi:ABC-type sugar transport system substrate-binding protein
MAKTVWIFLKGAYLMKKMFTRIFLTLTVLFLSACCETTFAASKDASEKKTVIGFVDMAIDEPAIVFQNAFIKRANELGYDVINLPSNFDVQQQITNIEDLVTQGVDIVYTRPINYQALGPAIEACNKANIPIITDDIIASEVPQGVTLNVETMNHYGYGAEQAKYLIAQMEKTPSLVLNIGYIWHPNAIMVTTQAKHKGFMETLKPYIDNGRVNILDEQSVEGDVSKAAQFTENWLTSFPNINVIIAPNDDGAAGVATALESQGVDLKEFFVLGHDGGDIGCQLVRDGKMDCTIFRNIVRNTRIAVDYLDKAVKGEKLPLSVSADTLLIQITRDNVDTFKNALDVY